VEKRRRGNKWGRILEKNDVFRGGSLDGDLPGKKAASAFEERSIFAENLWRRLEEKLGGLALKGKKVGDLLIRRKVPRTWGNGKGQGRKYRI